MLLLTIRWQDRQIRLRVSSRTKTAKVTQQAAELLGVPGELAADLRLMMDGAALDPGLDLHDAGVRDRAELRLMAPSPPPPENES